MTGHRVLVTGSRDWIDEALIRTVLRILVVELHPDGRPEGDERPVLIHGGARGADRIARDIWREWGLPDTGSEFAMTDALWRACGADCPPDRSCRRRRKGSDATYCSEAGHRRNWRMCEARPDVCIAFHLNGSPGTGRCIEYAESLGVPVRRFEVST